MSPRENQRSIYPRERIANLGMHYWEYGTPVSCPMLDESQGPNEQYVTVEAITGAVWDRIRRLSASVETSQGSEKAILQREKTLLGPIAGHFLSKGVVNERYVNEMLQKLRECMRQAREQDEFTSRIAALSGEETVDQLAQACTPAPSPAAINFIAKTRMTIMLIERTLREPTFLAAALAQSALLPFMKDYFFNAVGRETSQRQFATIIHTAAERIPWANLEPAIAISLRNRIEQIEQTAKTAQHASFTPKPPAAAPAQPPRGYREPPDVRLT